MLVSKISVCAVLFTLLMQTHVRKIKVSFWTSKFPVPGMEIWCSR